MSDPDGEAASARDTSGRAESGKRAPRPAAGLWIVATPIGNLGDLTARARELLAAADVVACEDTRRTGRLLASLGVRAKLSSYHDHSPPSVRAALIKRLGRGELVALASDAGTPLVSDPGYKLVRAAIEAGAPVSCAPGPSSPLAALVVSGLPTDRFLFAGYLPPREKARRDALAEVSGVRATLVFLESPRRLAASLAAMAAVLGDREAAVAREMTKRHEEVRRGRLAALGGAFAAAPPKGEVVVVVGPPPDGPGAGLDAEAMLDDALGRMSTRDAAEAVARATGRPRRELYERALRRRRDGPAGGEEA